MGYFVVEVKAKEPAVCHIDFDLFYGLPHAFDTVHVLDEGYLYQCNGVYARTAIVRAVFVFYKVVYEAEVYAAVYFPQEMVFRY